MALPKIYRLKKKKDFSRVFKRGKTIQGKFILTKYTRSSLPHPRIGIVVSSKVEKKAVIRNRLRRQAAEVLRSLIDRSSIAIDAVVVVRTSPDSKNLISIREDVREVFKKILQIK